MQSILELALVLLAVASPFLLALFLKHYFAYKSQTANKLAELDLKVAERDTEALQQHVLRLQQRIETLEAIVVDEGYDLKKRIAQL